MYKKFFIYASFLLFFFDLSYKMRTFDSNNYNMSLEKMLVTDFIDKSIDYLERVEASLSNDALSVNKRTNMLCDVLKKGISFGLDKGGYILKCTQDKIESTKEKAYRKWLDDIVYKQNQLIEENMIKNKYKKK